MTRLKGVKVGKDWGEGEGLYLKRQKKVTRYETIKLKGECVINYWSHNGTVPLFIKVIMRSCDKVIKKV